MSGEGAHDTVARRRVLERVLAAGPSMREDIQALGAFPFDLPEPLLSLTLAHVREVLARHALGSITDDDLQVWADAVEGRDDVELELQHHDILTDCLFELSTPAVTGRSVAVLAQEWGVRLAAADRGEV